MPSPSTSEPPLTLSIRQADSLIQKHINTASPLVVWNITELTSKGYSRTSDARTYIVDLSSSNATSPSSACFIVVKHPQLPANSALYETNSLPVIHQILSQIHTHTDIPIADPIIDITHQLVPYDVLICQPSPITSTSITTLATARKENLLTAQQLAYIDLQIGLFLGQLHSKVQNDWFGPPQLGSPAEPSYSWQESFTLLLETLLSEHQAAGIALPYEDIRRHLSRAIAYFLFDDVEVPSLVWLTGSEYDVYISLSDRETSAIAAILPNAAHAVWGDPLLESFFLPPAPSAAISEGYSGGGGRPLIVFSRQKTKRVWYSLFLGLIVLKEQASADTEVDEKWALDLIKKSVKALADAPCY